MSKVTQELRLQGLQALGQYRDRILSKDDIDTAPVSTQTPASSDKITPPPNTRTSISSRPLVEPTSRDGSFGAGFTGQNPGIPTHPEDSDQIRPVSYNFRGVDLDAPVERTPNYTPLTREQQIESYRAAARHERRPTAGNRTSSHPNDRSPSAKAGALGAMQTYDRRPDRFQSQRPTENSIDKKI
jgi:hypothetical protein